MESRSRSESRSRLLVVSVPFGGGHRSVAEAIAWALTRDAAGLSKNVAVIDGLDAISRRLSLQRLGAAAYALLTRPAVRPLYSTLFKVADRWPAVVGRCCYAIFGRRVRRWLSSTRPETVVSTFPFVTFVLGEAIADVSADTTLISFVTDGGRVNRSWFSGRCDMFLVSDEEALRVGRSTVTDPARVRCVPLPLRSGFDAPISRAHARAALGLDDEVAVLVWGGAQGIAEGVVALARAFKRERLTVAPIFVAGDNRRLAVRLTKAAIGLPRARIFERCDDVPQLLSAVDVVLGKPGWVSLAEAEAVGLHTVCFDALPGQEVENLRVHMRKGSASWSPDPTSALRQACAIAVRPSAPRRMSSAADHAMLCAAILDADPADRT